MFFIEAVGDVMKPGTYYEYYDEKYIMHSTYLTK